MTGEGKSNRTLARKISSLFTSDTDKQSPEGEMTFSLSEKAIASSVVELHDYIGLSFSEIAQCFPFTRKQIEEMYYEYEEEYPHVE